MNTIWLCFRYSGMESWREEGRKEKRQESVKTDFLIKPKKNVYLQPAIYIFTLYRMMLSLIHCFIHPIKANVNKPKKKPSVLISDIIQWFIYVLTIVWNSFFFCDYNFWLCILSITCSPPIGSTVDWITNVHGYVNESRGKHEMSIALLIDTKLYSLRHITHWFILFPYLQPIAKLKSETTNWRKIKWNVIEQSKQKIENENKITIAVFAFCIVFQTK